MERVRKIIGCQEAYQRGIYGTGIGIAVLDSGERVIIMSSLEKTDKINKIRGFTLLKNCLEGNW